MSLKHSGNWKAAQRNAVVEKTCGGITRLSSVRFTVHAFAITFIILYFARSNYFHHTIFCQLYLGVNCTSFNYLDAPSTNVANAALLSTSAIRG